MLGHDADNKPTILDYLIEDCWRAVLDYVPVTDIMRSEGVSRRWQEVLLRYLQCVRFDIEHPSFTATENRRDVCRLTLRPAAYPSFYRWTKKLGPSVVAIYCESEESLKIIKENCPNLEAATFIQLTENMWLKVCQIQNLKHLQRVSLKGCAVSDHCMNQLASAVLKELEIDSDQQVTAQCLCNIKPSLKSLTLKNCGALEAGHLFSAFDRLSDLTKLFLRDAPSEIFSEIHTVLHKMLKLERLYVIADYYEFGMAGGRFYESVSRLSRLKYLYVNVAIANNEDVEIVTGRCKDLRVLWLERCDEVTRRGVTAVCRNAGSRLTALCLQYSQHLTNDDAVLIVRSCPDLKSLDLYGCPRLSEGLLPRAAAARRRLRARRAATARAPLRLRTDDVYREDDTNEEYARQLKDKYPELVLYYHDFKDRKDYATFWNPE